MTPYQMTLSRIDHDQRVRGLHSGRHRSLLWNTLIFVLFVFRIRADRVFVLLFMMLMFLIALVLFYVWPCSFY